MSNSCNPMDCSPPGSSVHRIFQVRILNWVAISFLVLDVLLWPNQFSDPLLSHYLKKDESNFTDCYGDQMKYWLGR